MNYKKIHGDRFLVSRGEPYYKHETTYTDFDPPCRCRLRSSKDHDELSEEAKNDPLYLEYCEEVLGYSIGKHKTRKRIQEDEKTR